MSPPSKQQPKSHKFIGTTIKKMKARPQIRKNPPTRFGSSMKQSRALDLKTIIQNHKAHKTCIEPACNHHSPSSLHAYQRFFLIPTRKTSIHPSLTQKHETLASTSHQQHTGWPSSRLHKDKRILTDADDAGPMASIASLRIGFSCLPLTPCPMASL